MRTSIFILICFTIVFALGNITFSSQITFPITGQYQQSLLPEPLNFVIICFVLLVLASVFTIRTFGKRLSCTSKLVRKDMNLINHYLVLGSWYLLVTIFVLVRINVLNISAGYYSYYLTVLIAVLLYLVMIKHRIRIMKPDTIAIDNTDILKRRLFGYKRQKMDGLNSVSYNRRNNLVILKFKDGLENMELPLSDYDTDDVKQFIESIRKIKGDDLVLEEGYLKDFDIMPNRSGNANV